MKNILEKIEDKIQKEVEKAAQKFGESFDEAQVQGNQSSGFWKIRQNMMRLIKRFVKALETDDLKELNQIIIDTEIVCPVSGIQKLDRCAQV